MIKAETLKPCPFCGSGDIMAEGEFRLFVECLTCKAFGPDGGDRAEAVAKWNTRAEVKTESLWRFNGEVWEHKCADVQAGYSPAVKAEAKGVEGR